MAAEWYQHGIWPLLGATLTLAIPSVLVLVNVNRQANKALALQLRLKNVDFVNQQLIEFYNPIYASMLINKSAFESAGPPSFPNETIHREVAANVWAEIKTKVILPNNQRIREILRDKSHFISINDSLMNYIELQNHLAMYEVFQLVRSETYTKFQFPSAILEHVERSRNQLIKELSSLKTK